MLELLMITHNRLEYLKKALPSAKKQNCRLIVWDNNSGEETRDWLKRQDVDVYFHNKNESLAYVTTEVFSTSKSEFVGKTDSDIILPPEWSERLVFAHTKYGFGFIGGFHFQPEDLLSIRPNIEVFNGISLWRKHHIGGVFVIRREYFTGYSGSGVMGLSEYQAELGLVNGYLWNPVLWTEHMEDSRSPHYINSEEYNEYKLNTRGVDLRTYQTSIVNRNYLKENTL